MKTTQQRDKNGRFTKSTEDKSVKELEARIKDLEIKRECEGVVFESMERYYKRLIDSYKNEVKELKKDNERKRLLLDFAEADVELLKYYLRWALKHLSPFTKLSSVNREVIEIIKRHYK